MQRPASPSLSLSGRWHLLDPVVGGTLCAMISAVGYTAANICLRAVAHCDPMWVSCVKAAPTLVLVGPWMLRRLVLSQGIVPSLRTLGVLVLAGLLGQVAGNLVFQWTLGLVGIALAVPLCLGSMIASGAFMGRWILGEDVTPQMTAAMSVLVAAIVILSLGAPAASRSVVPLTGAAADVSAWLPLWGIAGACLAGVSYSVLGIVIRHGASGGTPQSTILVTISLVGTVVLGSMTWYRLGPQALWNTDPRDFAVMVLAGVCNAAAFVSLTTALRLTGVVYVNALNASQTAMAAVAGVLFFSEAPTIAMALGVSLTAVGLVLMKRRPQRA